MGVNIGMTEFNGLGDLALVAPEYGQFYGLGMESPDGPWPLNADLGMESPDGPWPLSDFDVNDWDSFTDESSFGDLACGCGMGASILDTVGGGGKKKKDEKPAEPPKSKFPVWAVVAGIGGLAAGVVAVVLIRKAMKRKAQP